MAWHFIVARFYLPPPLIPISAPTNAPLLSALTLLATLASANKATNGLKPKNFSPKILQTFFIFTPFVYFICVLHAHSHIVAFCTIFCAKILAKSYTKILPNDFCTIPPARFCTILALFRAFCFSFSAILLPLYHFALLLWLIRQRHYLLTCADLLFDFAYYFAS